MDFAQGLSESGNRVFFYHGLPLQITNLIIKYFELIILLCSTSGMFEGI